MVTKNKIVQYSLIICTFFLIALFSTSSLLAATYYVTQNSAGGKTGIDCANAKSLSWFNSNARAGDTAILCDGTYTTQIAPTNSGEPGSPIIYIADNQYGAVISTSSDGADFLNDDYITLDGLYFNNCGSRWIEIDNSDYLIIQNSKFYDSNAWTGIKLAEGSMYNSFIDNIFENAPASGNANGSSPADFIGIGPVSASQPDSNYTLIQGNTFGNCEHDAVFINYGKYTVIRDNELSNQWHTALNLNDDGPNLIELNRFYDQGSDMENIPIEEKSPYMRNNPAIQLNGTYNIIRNNILDNNGSGIMAVTYASAETEAHYNRVYSNTVNKGVIPLMGEAVDANYLVGNIFKNNIFTNAKASTYPGDRYPEPFNVNFRDNSGSGNLFYNNASYGSDNYRIRNTYFKSFDEIDKVYPSISVSGNVSEINKVFQSISESGNVSLDPKYTDADNRDFTLQSGSLMIDAGAWLTTITSSTASAVSSFKVADSSYFYDGWGIPGETGDTIKTQNGAITTIKKIDYEINTIKVSPAINIVKGEGVALPYSGSAPDIGAHEYQGAIAKPIPKNDSDIFQPGPDWCRDYGPCPEGQGDCDGDAECQGGLICAQDVGANYGWPADRDVCERPAGTIDIFQPGPDWCRDYGPCLEGQGDCDGDAECQSGLICAQDVGADYGWPSSRDVCVRPTGTKDETHALSSPTGFVIKSSQN